MPFHTVGPENTPAGLAALGWTSVLGIAIGLSMDAFAVAIATGLALAAVTPRHVFRLAFHFGLFQFMMPIIGWLAGQTLASCIERYDHWIAFAMLICIGGKMLFESALGAREEATADPTRGIMLVTLSIATSVDALAVGLSMGLLGVSVWSAAAVIGLVAGVLTMIGIRFGARLGPRWGRGAEALGGVILVAIGIRILVSHLAA